MYSFEKPIGIGAPKKIFTLPLLIYHGMELTYLYHSGFALEGNGLTLIVDYWRDSVPATAEKLLERPVKRYVLASHFHPDHFNPEVLRWQEKHADIVYIFSKDILKRRKATANAAHYLRKGEIYSDGMLRIEAFGSTDVGVSLLIEAEGKKIFHAGDLNNWRWEAESTEAEIRKAEGDFLKELEDLARSVKRLDVAMFPVDPRQGGDYMRGARQLLDRIPTEIFIPMHFWEDYRSAAAFAPYAASKGTRFIALTHEGQQITI